MAANPEVLDASFLQDIPIELVVELGRARMTVKELAHLRRDDVIELDRSASQRLDILVGGRVFASGEIVVVDDRVALRITALSGREEGGAR